MLNPTAEKAQEIIRKYGDLSGARGNWESHWKEIAERMLPAHSRLFSAKGYSPTQGEKRTEQIFDSTAAIALGRFASIMDSLLTPRNQTYHSLQASEPRLNKDRRVRLYFEEANRLLFKYRYAPKANFASQNQQSFESLGAYGTGCLFTDDLVGEAGLRYKNVFLGEVFFTENHQGIIDGALRFFPMKARQAMQIKDWKDSLPAKIKAAAKDSPEREFFFIHCVETREDRDPEKLDYTGMEFASYHVCVDEPVVLSEGGYSTFPYAISRYRQTAGEVYGRGPAMDVLPATKTLNEQKKTVLKQGHRAVDPVLLAHDDGIVDAFSLRPGAINAGGVSADGRALVQALPVGNIAIGKDLMDDERAVINDAFLVTLFQILIETPTMTATEVMERTREKGILLAPTAGRQQSEYMGPLIERELDCLSRQGLLPPMPPALLEAKGEYSIQHDSPLSRAQRAEEASGLMRSIEMALQVVNVTQNPEPLDHFNWDEIMPEVFSIQGMPERWKHDIKSVQRMRQARAQAQQQQTQIEAAPGAAALMNAGTKATKG